ncbi:efflux RND transporter periplasmic adaptor subunit [Sphingomonas sp. KRR8]|uniref:efflux RND transporter periplasmic adaptor subunit n=1 Tax=Sphingomonas sp. KRR8 TaxID=2942996 RepID=UPI0020226ED8|nr:efflux RND transporter periplasmic adaptor subunit [Sphingomonas sp. KRR8]URD59892.1 efflux RND transporter periplasmic adaptor subunit [Sphingomonas sp. KRR8]
MSSALSPERSRSEAPARLKEAVTGKPVAVQAAPSPTRTRKRRHNGWLIVGAILILAIAAAAFWLSQPVQVAVIRPYRGAATELVYATGFVEPVQPVAIASRLTAPVAAVLVDEGDAVRKGQPLVRLDDSDLRSAYAQAHALSIGASLTERRTLTLFRQGWVTAAARDTAVANAEAARAAERLAAAKIDQSVVRSAIDGTVIKRDIEPGELALPSRTLMLLGDPNRSRITATVDERDVPRIRAGQPALVSSDAWPGRVLRARVAELTPTGDPTQRAFRARLRLEGGPALPLGMSLEVNIVTSEDRSALLVPNSAIAGDAVWTIVDGRARRRPVTLGIRGQKSSAVVGLPADAVLIDLPGSDLKDGARVTVRK